MPKAAGSNSKRIVPASQEEWARSVLKRQLRKIRELEAGVQAGHDIEALHDMRVAVRRSRAALSLFRKSLPKGRRAHQSELRWLGGRLGPVRDMDVLLDRIEKLSIAEPAIPPSEVAVLVNAVAAEREKARSEMLAALNSDRYRAWKVQYESYLNSPFDEDRRPIAEGLPTWVEKPRKAFRRAARQLDATSTAEERHRVRILAKRYRYALEFAAEFLPPKLHRLPRALAKLQDALGAQQDAAVARSVLEVIAARNPGLSPILMEVVSRFERLVQREASATARMLGLLVKSPMNPA